MAKLLSQTKTHSVHKEGDTSKKIGKRSALRPSLEMERATIDQEWARVIHVHFFGQPAVIAGPDITLNKKESVLVRGCNINQLCYEIRLQQEQSSCASHDNWTIGYVNSELGNDQLPGLQDETGNSISRHTRPTLNFQTPVPVIFYRSNGMQTFNCSDTAAVRLQNMSQTAMKSDTDEKQSEDNRGKHLAETVGCLAISSTTK